MGTADKKRREAIRKIFLDLWDKAVGTPEYDKKQWMDLELLLGLHDPTDQWPPDHLN